jgi:hypothetical protein
MSRRLSLPVPAGLLALLLALPASGQEFTPPRPSPGAKVVQTVGTTELSVSYSRPGVKGRAIWGGLVPWGKAWRTGANEITQFTCADDVTIEGQKLVAGTYALVTTPNPDAVTFAFSTQKDMAGLTGYDPKTNVLSVTVKAVPAEFVERMQFTFDDPGTDSVTLTLRWDKLAIPMRIIVDTKAKMLASARTAVAAAESNSWRTPYRAASWAYDNGVTTDETAKWAAAAAKMKANFQTSGLLAKITAKGGDTKTATKLMQQSIAFGKADTTVAKEQVEANEKLLAEWTAKK